MKVLIIGAGWYGCHCAMYLLDHNVNINIIDKTNDFFEGSSSKNQNRLHLGFHYCRSFSTRKECMLGYTKFMEKYGSFTDAIPYNLYCIDNNSIIDFETYKAIYKHECIDFEEYSDLAPISFDTSQVTGMLNVKERFINYAKAKEYFKSKLSQYMISYDETKLDMDKSTYSDVQYDYIIDCTYSTLNNILYPEKCISFVYEYDQPIDFAITIVDGPFWSLYPYDFDKKLFTLTDVEYTPLGTPNVRDKIETKVKHYIPDFDKHFKYVSHFISYKAKTFSKTDDRSLHWHRHNNILYFSGGKITGIFSMEDILSKQLLQVL